MANSQVAMTEGSGKNAATYSISEGTTKEIQRMALNTNAGVEIGTSAAPVQVTLANTGANSTAVKVDNTAALDKGSGTGGSSTQRVIVDTSQLAALATTSSAYAAGVQPVALPSDQVPVATKAAASAWADGADTTFGAKADAKSTATDTTAITAMQVLKQISASVQAPPSQAVTNAGTFAVQSAVAGDVAAGSSDSGNPVKAGGKATNAEPTALTTGQRANLITDLVGKLIVLPYANPENFVSGVITSSMTGTTSTSLIAAPASGLRNYITQITVSNAHATVGTDIIIQDGSGGTTLYNIPAAAVYGGSVITFPTPLRQPTTATAIFCANVTTGASTKVSASGYKGV